MKCEDFIKQAELAVFIPGYIKVYEKEFNESFLTQKLIKKAACNTISPRFFFSEVYTEKVSTFQVKSQRLPRKVTVEYELEGNSKKFQVEPEIYLSLIREPIKIQNPGERSFFLIPIALSAVIENAPTSIDGLISLPFFLAWESECGEGKCNKEERYNLFVCQLEEVLGEIMGESAEVHLSNRGRFFIVSLELHWKEVQGIFGENATVEDFIKRFSREFYGLAVTDEGYRAVKEDYARDRIESWNLGNRIYFSKLISPVSIIQVKADRNRVEFEKMTLSKCSIWKEHVLNHSKERERRTMCHHGLFHQGEYLALTFATIDVFKSLTKSIMAYSKEHRRGKVSDIEKLLRTIENAGVHMESLLKTLNPRRVSKIPELTTIIERMYEARGLSSFYGEVKEALQALTGIMAEGEELIEKRLEREKFQHLEIGITLLEALPLGYVLQGVFQLLGLEIPTPLVVGATVPLLLFLWWKYKSTRISRWEREQTDNFMKMAEKVLESLF